MNQHWDTLGPAGLAYFGSVCASMTHELRNSLAIINENAGLVQDFLAMAERGHQLDPQRLATSFGRIQKHVAVANDGLTTLNRFAHLPDSEKATIDLAEECAHSARLHARLATRAEIDLAAPAAEAPVEVKTSPYHLSQVLHLCLAEIMKGSEGSVSLETQESPQGATIIFKGAASFTQTEELALILNMLGITLNQTEQDPKLVFINQK